jgi:putative heme transporter
MSKTSEILKTNWKAILNIATVLALVFLIYAVRSELVVTFKNLARVNGWALLLLIPIEWGNYFAQAKMYQGLFRVVGNKVNYRKMFELSLELNFINSVFPSVGASGIGYFGVRMRQHDISVGKASLVQIMKLMLVLVSFEVLMIFGLLMLALGGRVNNFTILVSGSLTTLLIVVTLLVMFLVGSKKRVDTTITALSNVIHAIARTLHLTKQPFNIERLRVWGDELHSNYLVIRKHYPELVGPTLYALLANATEVAAVYAVYLAFGHWVNPGAIILAYAVANFAGLVSVLPGGIGVYEAIMLGVLAASGIRASLSIPVVIMYRVMNTLIQLPPGYYFYHRTLHGGNSTPPVAEEHAAT